MITGVRVIVPKALMSDLRMSLNEGTAPAPLADHPIGFCENSWVGRGPFRPLSEAEASELYAVPGTHRADNTLALVRFPQPLIANDAIRCLHEAATPEKAAAIAERSETKEAIEAIEGYMESFLVCQRPMMRRGLVIRPPGLLTVVIHPKEEKLLGLHMDNWDPLPLHQKNEADNRIAVNLGPEPRYFLFINLTAVQMLEALFPGLPASACTLTGSALGKLFMQRYPEYPLVRLEIRPGEAYIAPTENLVHEGSTMGMTSVDLNLTHRGAFGFMSLEAADSSGLAGQEM
jgi:hypothetical protein